MLLLNKKKIPYELQLIDGLPGDNYKSLKESLDWLFMLKPVRITIMRFMLLPGTYLRQHAKDFGIRYSPSKPPYYTKESDTFSF
jgi:coproporphyrinogen III oxidase-like Fe-S oxidoreductase